MHTPNIFIGLHSQTGIHLRFRRIYPREMSVMKLFRPMLYPNVLTHKVAERLRFGKAANKSNHFDHSPEVYLPTLDGQRR